VLQDQQEQRDHLVDQLVQRDQLVQQDQQEQQELLESLDHLGHLDQHIQMDLLEQQAQIKFFITQLERHQQELPQATYTFSIKGEL
jgi:hypothetical protein